MPPNKGPPGIRPHHAAVRCELAGRGGVKCKGRRQVAAHPGRGLSCGRGLRQLAVLPHAPEPVVRGSEALRVWGGLHIGSVSRLKEDRSHVGLGKEGRAQDPLVTSADVTCSHVEGLRPQCRRAGWLLNSGASPPAYRKRQAERGRGRGVFTEERGRQLPGGAGARGGRSRAPVLVSGTSSPPTSPWSPATTASCKT